MKSWLVTGGCGFIGSNIVKKIYNMTTDRIVILDNLSTGSTDILNFLGYESNHPQSRLEFIHADLCDEQTINRALEGQDYVVHLAAQSGVLHSNENPTHSFRVNSHGTFQLLNAALRTNPSAIVMASSGAVIGSSQHQFGINDRPIPRSIYGATKASTEMFGSAFSHAFGLNIVTLRFGNVFGPWSAKKESIIPKFIKMALKQEPFEIYGTGMQTRDYIYVDDLVDALILATFKGKPGNIYHIAGGIETTVNEVVTNLRRALKMHGIATSNPKNTEPNPMEVQSSSYNISATIHELGWQPTTSLEVGLERTVDWFVRRAKKIDNFDLSLISKTRAPYAS